MIGNKVKVSTVGQWKVISLNRPEKLNVLDLELVDQFLMEFKEGTDNNDICGFVLMGEGERAFCAGGDVVSVVKGQKNGLPYDFFFRKEYELDLAIHKSQKPVITFGHGIIMGGGMGLMMGGNLKLLAPKAMIAMPEVTIGFFPDVGASFFLNNIDHRLKIFLGLTGARLGAVESQSIGLFDGICELENLFQLLETSNDLSEVQKNFGSVGPIEDKGRVLRELVAFENIDDLLVFDEKARELRESEASSDWLKQSLSTYLKGSPFSRALTYRYLNWSTGKSIEKCFEMDLLMAKIVYESGDFHEGVRALLVDKDKSPNWKDKELVGALERVDTLLEGLLI